MKITNKMEKVYGIHQGCIYEGGGTGSILYKKKDDAVAEAEKIFNSKIAYDEEFELEELEEFGTEDYEVMSRHREQFKWRKCDIAEGRWHNTVDEIEVVEYIVK